MSKNFTEDTKDFTESKKKTLADKVKNLTQFFFLCVYLFLLLHESTRYGKYYGLLDCFFFLLFHFPWSFMLMINHFSPYLEPPITAVAAE